MSKIKPFSKGPKILVNFGNRILEEVKSASILPSATIRPSQSVDGTTLSAIIPAQESNHHALTAYDASSGATPRVGVTPGIIIDQSNPRTLTPTIGGVPINTQTGSPPAYPALTVAGGDTVLYFAGTVTNTTGALTAVSILSGTAVPDSTASEWYLLISTLNVSITGGRASVQCLNDSLSGSQAFSCCGLLPLVDGTAYRNWVY